MKRTTMVFISLVMDVAAVLSLVLMEGMAALIIELTFVFVGHIDIIWIAIRICKCEAMRVSLPTSWF
jgi:hypothetical protein